MNMKKIVITLGQPEGISPEITIKALNSLNLPENDVILAANKDILEYCRSNLGLELKKNYQIINIPFEIKKLNIGHDTKEGGEFAFRALEAACRLVQNNEAGAIVTAPVSKYALNLAGHNYSGQTEIIEHFIASDGQKAEMTFVCSKFSVMLMTRHIPLSQVSEFIKKDLIISRIEKLEKSFKRQLNISSPRFALCGLNPHAGESGLLGFGEVNEIIPAAKELRSRGINISGPFPADALFLECLKEKPLYDCIIAMYHDQGLIPVKLLERDSCVNASLGLNVLRTSPAHGTAYDIAGKNCADASSMINAVKLALKSASC